MTEHERDLLTALIEAGVDFAIVGGAAVVFHGHLRDRNDLDIILRQNRNNVEKFFAALPPQFGAANLKENSVERMLKPKARISFASWLGVDVLSSIDGAETEVIFNDLVYGEFEALCLPYISKEKLIECKRHVGQEIDRQDVEALERL